MECTTEYIISHLPEEKAYWFPYEIRKIITDNFFLDPGEVEDNYLRFRTNGVWTVDQMIILLDKVWSDICENEGIDSTM